MRIIIYKPAGVEMPGRSLLTRAKKYNPHGCGLCSPSTFYKGLSFAALLKAAAKVGVDEPCLLHFRWATHGSVKRENCHPFYDEATGTYFMHNGVLSVRPPEDMTDSEYVFRRDLAPACADGLFTETLGKAVGRALEGSRFAFMQGDKVRLFGHWLEGLDGMCYSNGRLFY